MKRIRSIVYRLLVGALLLNLLWLLAAWLIDAPALISPIEVYAHLDRVITGTMLDHLLASLRRIAIGIPVSLLLGISIAWLMYRYRRSVGRVLGALVYLCYPIPKLALLPVVMLLAGLGDVGKVAMIVLILLFQIIINVRDSLYNIPKETFYVATSLGTAPWGMLRHIIIPATLPDVLSSLRVAIGTAISVLFVTETYGTDRGMGYFIIDSWMRINYIDMYGGIVVLSIMGFMLFLLTDLAEAYFCRWRDNR